MSGRIQHNHKTNIGDVYGRWKVIGGPERRNGRLFYECECECGKVSTVDGSSLRGGGSRSCGCLLTENGKYTRTHGKSKTLIHKKWRGMKARCYNKNHKGFHRYGGRGIYVCSAWKKSFQSFMEWAYKNGYDKRLQIDRIDNDGPYSPENCRWVDGRDNSNNRRDTIRLEYGGELIPISVLARRFGLKRGTLRARIFDYGWDVKRAVETTVT